MSNSIVKRKRSPSDPFYDESKLDRKKSMGSYQQMHITPQNFTIVDITTGDGRQILVNAWESIRIGNQYRLYKWPIVGKLPSS